LLAKQLEILGKCDFGVVNCTPVHQPTGYCLGWRCN
jgi:hypothetical protein